MRQDFGKVCRIVIVCRSLRLTHFLPKLIFCCVSSLCKWSKPNCSELLLLSLFPVFLIVLVEYVINYRVVLYSALKMILMN